ncbi:LytR/AlgR family response regulator transcription factor [Tunicatimonas pelagia]|uniref:LytR/AlgR family response regulator transcription factor n=1 Tax=Tunicatimonas pelagia TaxID=931531 RepID=UPI00266511F0|nr:LytTR family DNA-binding domain-containing protein [Tunicatimonas pelagia]WKN44756.1 LytTR family DNA-binding domain-containing protein [Tunicatimonas pelagia]
MSVEKKLSCVVVDDDAMTLKIIESLVKKTKSLAWKGSFQDPVEAANYLQQQPIDLLFVDVEMPDMSGLELIKTLSFKPQIIVISSKKEYALDAFEHEVTDYLLKPVANYARFLQAVQRAKAKHKPQTTAPLSLASSEHIYLKIDSLLVKFDLKDIHWVEAYGDYVRIKTPQKLYTVYATLKSVEDTLPKTQFLRVHRSFIIRVDKIMNIDQGNLQIADKIIPISQSYRKKLMESITTL